MSRAEEIKTERRRRNTDALGGKRRRLGLTAELDRKNFEYRWANDDGTRIHDLTVNDDWEIVQERKTLKADGTGVGTETAVPVGMGEHGRPVRAVLLRKRKDWYDDDMKQAQRRIDEQEAAIKAGNRPDGGSADDKTYVPKGGIVFENGAKS